MMTHEPSPYAYFDDIVCITLKHREDRREHMNAVTTALSIPLRYQMVERHEKGGMYGCFASHVEVITDCYHKGCKRILIFEDDVVPTPSYSINDVKTAVCFMQSEEDRWDMFYFGYFVFNTNVRDMIISAAPTSSKHVIRYAPLATHAYCVNRHAMEKILQVYPPYIGNIHLDVFYSKLGLRSFCYVPMMFEQKMCMPSDIPAYNVVEKALRSVSCVSERTQLNHKISKGAFWLQHTSSVLMVVVLIMWLLVAFSSIASLTNARGKFAKAS